MKIRTRLVANSSSSSFICDYHSYETVAALAIAMLSVRDEDDSNKDSNKIIKEYREKLSSTKLDLNTNVMFSSCNYDTYILYLPKSKIYCVDTCNNVSWDNIITTRFDSLTELNEIAGKEVQHDFEGFNPGLQHLGSFWHLDLDLLITYPKRVLDFSGYCKEHFSDLAYINNSTTLQCPHCYFRDVKLNYSTIIRDAQIQKELELFKSKRIFNLRS